MLKSLGVTRIIDFNLAGCRTVAAIFCVFISVNKFDWSKTFSFGDCSETLGIFQTKAVVKWNTNTGVRPFGSCTNFSGTYTFRNILAAGAQKAHKVIA